MMDIGLFSDKLHRANPKLYIDIKNVNFSTNIDYGTCGIYLIDRHREKIDLADVSAEHLETVKRHNESDLEYLTFTNATYVPEVNEYTDRGSIKSPGLRELIQRLNKLGHLSERQVRKHFGSSYLTKSWWDTMTDKQKKEYKLQEKE